MFSTMSLSVCLPALFSGPVRAQAPWGLAAPTTPNAQRNALNVVKSQVDWLQNAIRTAPNYRQGGYGVLRQAFDGLRGAYFAFKPTLTQKQLYYGANDLAELDAGLDIIQEAFGNFQEDINDGRDGASALHSLCQVLGQATGVWWQELKQDSARLGVGRP